MTSPNELEIIKDLFWSGEIGDSEFIALATEAGATVDQISAFLTEVREHDGIAA